MRSHFPSLLFQSARTLLNVHREITCKYLLLPLVWGLIPKLPAIYQMTYYCTKRAFIAIAKI